MTTKRKHHYQAEEDLRVLVEECAIRKDAKRFRAARQLARVKLADIGKIAGEKRRATIPPKDQADA